MPFLQVNGRKLRYEITGVGETLLLLHHGFGSLDMWHPLVSGLSGAGFQVLSYDRRGYGQSEPGPNYRQFYESDGFRAYMVGELAGLLDGLGLDQVHLLGHCEGGVTGVDFCAAHPQRVKSLAMSSVQAWSLVDMITFNREKFPKSFDELDPKMAHKFEEWHPGHARELYEMARVKGGAYGVGYFDLRPVLPSVKCPTLVIYPDRSALFEVDQSIALYRALPFGELAVMPACGHNTYEYQPDEYLRLFLDFHRRQAARGYQPGKARLCGPDPTQATCAG